MIHLIMFLDVISDTSLYQNLLRNPWCSQEELEELWTVDDVNLHKRGHMIDSFNEICMLFLREGPFSYQPL